MWFIVRSALVVAALTAWVSVDSGGARTDLTPDLRALQEAASRRMVDAAREQAVSSGLSLDAGTLARLLGSGSPPLQAPSSPPTSARPTPEHEARTRR